MTVRPETAERREREHPGGLTSAQAEEQLRLVGSNELPPPVRDRLVARFVRQLREPMSVLLIAAAVVSVAGLGKLVDGAAIMTVVLLNVIIALVQEGKAARALEALRGMEAPSSRVVRDGRVRSLPASRLVPGDLVVLSAGDRVPADMELIDASALECDESLLTGESLPVSRDLGEPLLSGTLVVRGSARGVVVETGRRTRLGAIASHLRESPPPTPLQRELSGLSRRLGIVAVIVAVMVFFLTLVRLGLARGGIEESFLSAAALAVAAVPEGLPTVVTVALALGVRRMAEHGAIIRRLPAVETLGSTTVLLSDKTGTLTQNRLRVSDVVLASGAAAGLDSSGAAALLRAVVLCNDATLESAGGDPLEVALIESASMERTEELRAAYPRVAEIPFDSRRKRMTTLHKAPFGSLLTVKGAPEAVLALCDVPDRDAILAMCSEMAGRGVRVLGCAERQFSRRPTSLEASESNLAFLGLIGFRDPVRPEAALAVAEARSAGVRLVMVTGDHAGTALAVAEEVGLVSGARDAERSIYARVDPEDKLELATGLQAEGEVVAVTGDGVNDAPALRNADIGVAMGRGSEVAREASDMIVTDDNLGTIVRAIREGRGIYDNIRKVVDYLIAGNLAEIAVVVTGLLVFPGLGVPLLPLQLLWVNLLTDAFPALALGVDAIHPEIMRRGPRPRGAHLLDADRIRRLAFRGGVIAAASLAALSIDRFMRDGSWAHSRTILFTTLVVAHLLYVFIARLPRRGPAARPNKWLLGALGVGLGLQVLAVATPVMRPVFGTTALSVADWLLACVIGVLPIAAMWAFRSRKEIS